MFDDEQFLMNDFQELTVILFSGGLDSLSGTLDILDNTTNQVCLVSHQPQPGTAKTQHALVNALKGLYPNRVFHYKFQSNLKGMRAVEETQRTRAFLYASVAYAIGQAFGQDSFTIFENGITGMNFPRRADLFGARASRTTHPQTVHHLVELFSLLLESSMQIELPFLWKTKTDIMASIRDGAHSGLVPSSVSCSKTFQNLGQATHCGGCSQCIDRRFAAYGSKADDIDESGIYANDIIANDIASREIRTTAVDYVRQAKNFGTWSDDYFFTELSTELSQIVDYLPGSENEFQRLEQVRDLCRRHGEQVAFAMKRMRDSHDDLYSPVARGSLLGLISDREYLKDPIRLLVERLCQLLDPHVGRMFAGSPPQNERDLNRKINVLLKSHEMDLRSEHPAVSFAGGYAIPDHGNNQIDVFIEAKYIRSGTSPSKASEGMAADLSKYPQDKHILFVVYDPMRAIADDGVFRDDLEALGRCTVLVVR